LHLLKLPPRDGHETILPAMGKLQRQKRRSGIWVAAFCSLNKCKINIQRRSDFVFIGFFALQTPRTDSGRAADFVSRPAAKNRLG
jgi:hypothetical protein